MMVMHPRRARRGAERRSNSGVVHALLRPKEKDLSLETWQAGQCIAQATPDVRRGVLAFWIV